MIRFLRSNFYHIDSSDFLFLYKYFFFLRTLRYCRKRLKRKYQTNNEQKNRTIKNIKRTILWFFVTYKIISKNKLETLNRKLNTEMIPYIPHPNIVDQERKGKAKKKRLYFCYCVKLTLCNKRVYKWFCGSIIAVWVIITPTYLLLTK